MASSTPHVGIDFGTSNSVLAVADGDGVRFARFEVLNAPTQSWRSLLFFDPEEQEVQLPIQYYAGGEAIEAHLRNMGEGRLIQSFKTHLTSSAIGRTQIGHHAVGLEELIALFLLRLRKRAQAQFGCEIEAATFGRPVRFAGGRSPEDDEQAQLRLEAAAKLAGFSDVRFELEPVAAAYHYAQALTRPELVLVADFGGGTTDFCLMRLDPGAPDGGREIIATGGVGAAGDDLDAALIEHVVSPHLGKGGTYVEMNREQPIPASYYFKLSHWHHLSFLRSARVRTELERLLRGAREPEKIEALIHIIEHNQGFHLHKAVEQVKIELSSRETAQFHYHDGPVDIRAEVKRSAFEAWIEPHTSAIAQCLDQTLADAGVAPSDVHHVFMAGGTAFVPAVRKLFEQRFGAARLRSGDELMSIASGLALRAAHG